MPFYNNRFVMQTIASDLPLVPSQVVISGVAPVLQILPNAIDGVSSVMATLLAAKSSGTTVTIEADTFNNVMRVFH